MTEKTLRWGLLSTARINDRILGAVAQSDRSTVMAVASRTAARAKAYASDNDIPVAFGAYRELLESDKVDVVYISTPNPQHVRWGIEAARAGKSALIEKPIALDVNDVERLAKAAEDAKVVIQEASMMRFHGQTTFLRQLVSDGRIGAPRWAQGSFSFNLRRSADIRLDADGGGSLWDLGCYPVTLFQAVLNLRPIEASGFQRRGEHAVDMTFAALVRYEGGVMGQFVTSMEAVPSWSCEFVGSNGYLRVTYPWLSHLGVTSTVELVSETGGTSASTFGHATDNLSTSTYTYPKVNAYVDEVKAMEEMILDAAPPLFPLEESAMNVATIEALIKSAVDGRPYAVSA